MNQDPDNGRCKQLELGELRNYIDSVQKSHPSIGACRRLSGKVSEWCSEHFGEEHVTVRQGYFNGETGVAQHFYIQIEHQDQIVVVDPTVSQFTYENWIHGKADTYIPDSEIPNIGIIDASMDIFSRYE